MKSEEFKYLVAKFRAGTISAQELQTLERWLNKEEEVKQRMLDELTSAQEHDHLLVQAYDYQKLFQKIKEQTNEKPVVQKTVRLPLSLRNFPRQWAALLAVAFLIGSLVSFLVFGLSSMLKQKETFYEVMTPVGTRSEMLLPDGSKVWLNAGSKLRYSSDFSKNNRTLHLDGEAFFKVKSDKSHPFLVETHSLVVKATGTEFNVLAYSDDSDTQVVLKEGRVSVLDKKENEIKVMNEGHSLVLSKQLASFDYQKVNAEDYSSWIYGRLVFRNKSMKEVLLRMERYYGVHIEVADPELQNLHLKATFENESIEDALRLLESTAAINFRFEKRELREDGTYGTAKIIITKK